MIGDFSLLYGNDDKMDAVCPRAFTLDDIVNPVTVNKTNVMSSIIVNTPNNYNFMFRNK